LPVFLTAAAGGDQRNSFIFDTNNNVFVDTSVLLPLMWRQNSNFLKIICTPLFSTITKLGLEYWK
jgi:hypothetical protein